MIDGRLNIDQIRSALSVKRIGTTIELLDEIESTNDYVWSRNIDSIQDGLAVFTEYQTKGRGRMGRTWLMPRGAGILCSTLLAYTDAYAIPPGEYISLISAIAVAEAIQSGTQLDARIEWPNDILINGRKVAGILVESHRLPDGTYGYVVGIGINCLQHRRHFPDELSDHATSLDIESRHTISRENVAVALLQSFDAWLTDPARWSESAIRSAFTRSAVPCGRRVRLMHGGEVFIGHIVDVEPTSSIVVQLDNGYRRHFPAAGTTILRDENAQ